jgi:branched-subunit amino acid ABC-type transport system permease component
MSTFFLQQLINGLTLGSVYGLIAIGYTMVYGIIGMINFAHGEVYMISAYLCAIGLALLSFFGLQSFPLLILGTLVFTIVVTGVYGWTIERIAYKPLRNSTRLAPLISAIGMSLILQNYAQLSQGRASKGCRPCWTAYSPASGRRFRADNLHQSVYPGRLVCRHAGAHLDNQPYPAGADVPRGTAGS